MANELLDDFGKLLIHQVRDEVITALIAAIEGKVASSIDDPIQKTIASLSPEAKEALQTLMPLAVDMTLLFFLSLIEQNKDLDITIKTENGSKPLKDLCTALSNELHSKGGWINRYSRISSYEEDIS